LRVETCWDTTGRADIDLHLHRAGSTTPWFTTTPNVSPMNLTYGDINPDDCYYFNCTANAWTCPFPGFQCAAPADWGYGASPLAECSGTPLGPVWSQLGGCANPRLDIDNIDVPGVPENINVDRPQNGATYRVMVHYFGPAVGGPTTHPLVNVYCGGRLLATYGAAPDLVAGFDQAGGFGEGPMWRVVDVQPTVNGSGTTTGCTLSPLHPPGTSSGYWVTNNVRTY
jgi:hypothetical protein